MTNEQKCPVCGEGLRMDIESTEEQGRLLLQCHTNGCYVNRITPDYVKSSSTLIQSRIDKAVIAERERCLTVLKIWINAEEKSINQVVPDCCKESNIT